MGMPDFLITKASNADASNAGAVSRKHWRDVELVIGYSAETSAKALDDKFGQWLQDIWVIFDQQPHRRFCFGILFLQPHAFLCYADRGCATVSQSLEVTQQQGSEILVQFLTSFMSSDDPQRGRDPELIESDGISSLTQGGCTWTVGESFLHVNTLIGRNIQVYEVNEQEGQKRIGVCKEFWEEIAGTTDKSSDPHGAQNHPCESDVIQSLTAANIRGLPLVWGIEHAKVVDSFAMTASVPSEGEFFRKRMRVLTLRKATSIHVTTGQPSGHLIGMRDSKTKSLPGQNEAESEDFFSPTQGQRQLYRILMSRCQPLKTTIESEGFAVLMPIIRDAMICYYECYKISGWLHAGEYSYIYQQFNADMSTDISDKNIMVATQDTVLTGLPSSEKPNRGTIIDWNYSFEAHGRPTSRNFRSGIPAFMALDLLDSKSTILDNRQGKLQG